MKPGDSIGFGFLLGILLHVAGQGILYFVLDPGFAFVLIGATQAVYLVPAVIYFTVKRQGRTAKGLWIVIGVTFLLNAACFGVIFATLGQM